MGLFRCFYLFLQFWITLATIIPHQKSDINYEVDRFFEKLNTKNEKDGTTFKNLGSGKFGDYSYEGATVIGVDSMNRTGDCLKESVGSELKYTFHVGLRLLQVFFKKLTVEGISFSASSRLYDNSLELSYTIETLSDAQCDVRVNSLKVEKAGVAVLYSSHPKFDGTSIDGFLKNQFIPSVNNMLVEQQPLVRDFLVRLHCRKNPHLLSQPSHLLSSLNSFIFG